MKTITIKLPTTKRAIVDRLKLKGIRSKLKEKIANLPTYEIHFEKKEQDDVST